MRRQSFIICFCLVVTLASAQPKTFKEAVRIGLDSIANAYGWELREVNIQADTAIRPYIDEQIVEDPKAILYLHYFERRMGYQEGQMWTRGTIIFLKPQKSSENFSFVTAPIGTQLKIVTKVDRATSEEEGSFWESIVQPTLVTLGAIAIIALFFLIRS